MIVPKLLRGGPRSRTSATRIHVVISVSSYHQQQNHFTTLPDWGHRNAMANEAGVGGGGWGIATELKYHCLRWLKTVSSTFQDVDFDES